MRKKTETARKGFKTIKLWFIWSGCTRNTIL